jgi:hypothetical protein
LAIDPFDSDIAGAEGLRKLNMEKLLEFRHAHFCNCHIAVPALACGRLLQ